MEVGILATDGGPHPPEKWAQATVSQILSIAAGSDTALARDARALEAKLIEILTRHHALAQEYERGSLATEGTERLASTVDTSRHVPDAVDDIMAAARGTSFAEHFNKPRREEPVLDAEGKPVEDAEGEPVVRAVPSTREYLERVVGLHFHDNMMVERSWHADEHPEHPHAKAFKAAQLEGHALLVDPSEGHEDKGGREVVAAVLRSMVPRSPDEPPAA